MPTACSPPELAARVPAGAPEFRPVLPAETPGWWCPRQHSRVPGPLSGQCAGVPRAQRPAAGAGESGPWGISEAAAAEAAKPVGRRASAPTGWPAAWPPARSYPVSHRLTSRCERNRSGEPSSRAGRVRREGTRRANACRSGRRAGWPACECKRRERTRTGRTSTGLWRHDGLLSAWPWLSGGAAAPRSWRPARTRAAVAGARGIGPRRPARRDHGLRMIPISGDAKRAIGLGLWGGVVISDRVAGRRSGCRRCSGMRQCCVRSWPGGAIPPSR